MGFRKFCKRAIKPAALVLAVGALSMSLIVTTPSNAYAFTEKLPVKETWVMGAAKTVAPVAMAAVSVTPIGWALRLGQLGFLAYSTMDMWMPFVTGTFGGSDPNGKVETGGQANPVAGFKVDPLGVTSSGYTGIVRNTSSTANSIYWVKRVDCKHNSTGVVRVQSSVQGATIQPGNLVGANNTCNTGETAVGGSISAECSLYACAAGYVAKPGPENFATFGTLAPAGIDPRGNDVGYQGSSECINSAGALSWVTGPTVPGDNGAMLMPSCEAAGKGHGTGRTKVQAFKPNGTTETVWDTGAQPLSDPATPLCDPGRATSGCVLEVTKDGQPCATGDVECENWASESKKEGNTRYGCKLGPYVMPLSACSLLERAYLPGGSPLNDQNTDGDPSTSSPLGPSGQPVAAPAPVTTGTGTGSQSQPVPGGAGQPGAGAESDASACWPTGWGMLNPLEWVYKPVVCAAKALFQPTKSVQTRVTSMQAGFANKIPMTWFGAGVEGVSGGACPTNWAVEVQGNSYSLICGTPADGIIQSFRPVLGAMLIVAMLWPLIRSLFYAAIPVFKVNPS